MSASRTTTAATVVIAVMATLAVVAAGLLLARVGIDDAPDQVIEVAGSGMVLVGPDHATVRATAQGTDLDAEAALDAANERMQQVLEAVRDVGIADEDLSTQAVRTVRQVDRSGPDRGEPGDWLASITLVVEIDDLDLVGEVLGAASDAGAQQVDGPHYTVRDATAAYDEALALAMEEARTKADRIAEESGREVAGVRSVVEGQTARPSYGDGDLTAAAAGGASFDEIAVNPGETERIEARVTVVYEHDG